MTWSRRAPPYAERELAHAMRASAAAGNNADSSCGAVVEAKLLYYTYKQLS